MQNLRRKVQIFPAPSTPYSPRSQHNQDPGKIRVRLNNSPSIRCNTHKRSENSRHVSARPGLHAKGSPADGPALIRFQKGVVPAPITQKPQTVRSNIIICSVEDAISSIGGSQSLTRVFLSSKPRPTNLKIWRFRFAYP